MSSADKLKKIWRDLVMQVKMRPVIGSMLLDSRPISLAQAKSIFREWAQHEDMLFDRIVEGCEARTHLMCESIIAQGLRPYKAWALSESFISTDDGPRRGEHLRVVFPDGKRIEGDASWDFHVAPSLPVQLSPNVAKYLVFDPGLFDGLVTKKQWGACIHAPSYGLHVEPFGRIPPDCYGSYAPLLIPPMGTDLRHLSLARMEKIKNIPPMRHQRFPSLFPV